MKYDLVIYDCDGTLVDTEYPVNEAFLDKLREHGPADYAKFDVEYILHNCVGGTVYSIFDRMAQDVTNVISNEARDRVIVEYQDVFPIYLAKHITPDAQMIEVLETLSQYFKGCVASNGRTRNVVNSVKAAGLSHIFGANIFTAEHVVNGKPAPDLILYAAAQMGITDMSRVLHIEDADRGARAGIAAGATVAGFTKHMKDKKAATASLKAVGVEHVFDTWQDFAAFAMR